MFYNIFNKTALYHIFRENRKTSFYLMHPPLQSSFASPPQGMSFCVFSPGCTFRAISQSTPHLPLENVKTLQMLCFRFDRNHDYLIRTFRIWEKDRTLILLHLILSWYLFPYQKWIDPWPPHHHKSRSATLQTWTLAHLAKFNPKCKSSNYY